MKQPKTAGLSSDAGHVPDEGCTDTQPPQQHDPAWYISTNRWFCEDCLCSHPISPKDLPSSSKNHSSCHWKNSNFFWGVELGSIMAGDYYNLQDHHKQIILRNVQHFDMLGLEARRHLRHLLRTATFHIQDDHLPLTLQVKPRVVKQQKSGTSTTKLLVKYRWLYTPVQQRVITLTDLKPIKLCTHVGFQHDIADALLDVTSITSRMHVALCTPHGSIQNSKLPMRSGFCRDCHLEYTVGQWVGDNRVFIVVWQDISPQDPALDSTGPTQTSDDGSHMPIYYLFEKSKHVFTPPEEEHVLTPPVEAFKPPKKRFEWIKAHLKKIRL